MAETTFVSADLTTLCRLDELGLEVMGQRLEPDEGVLHARSSKQIGQQTIRGHRSYEGDRSTRPGERFIPVSTLLTEKHYHRLR